MASFNFEADPLSASYLLEKVGELVKFLHIPESTVSGMCQFIALRTFAFLNCDALYLSQLNLDGNIRLIEGYGFPKDEIAQWRDSHIQEPFPFKEALRKDSIIWHGRSGTKTVVTLPLDIVGAPIASIRLMLTKEVQPSTELMAFLATIGNVISLRLSHDPRFKGCPFIARLDSSEIVDVESRLHLLSARQLRVLELIHEGRTNALIAKELGFSESTVRQETIRIYEKLEVSGRREAADHLNRLVGSAAEA